MYGPLKIHWDRLNRGESGVTWDELLVKIRQIWKGSLWRWNQMGDFLHLNGLIDALKLQQLTAANRGRMGWGYTHHECLTGPNAKGNRKAIKAANKGGFTVNLSGNSMVHADKLKKLNIAPVVCIVPQDTPNTALTPAGNRVVVCPAQYQDSKITCARCGFCQRADRNVIIGFRSHGSGAKYAEAAAKAGA